jgi:hypothetical protein
MATPGAGVADRENDSDVLLPAGTAERSSSVWRTATLDHLGRLSLYRSSSAPVTASRAELSGQAATAAVRSMSGRCASYCSEVMLI